MYFANPWGLVALAAVPAIIAIHLFHRRFPPLVVAGLHLWTPETRQTLAGRRVERLPVSTSLILELLAAVLLAAGLSEPHFGGLSEAVHLVVVLDSSASMSAKAPGSGGVSFRDADRERTQEFLLRWSPDGGRSYRDIVRQQFNFSPSGSTRETEDYSVSLDGVTALELRITPDIRGIGAVASMEQLRLM